MQVDGISKGGLNELLETMLQNESKYIPNHELKQILHRIENDATEIYHTVYGLDDMRIRFNIYSNEDSDIGIVGRQSAISLGFIRKSIKKNLNVMQENMRTEFEKYLILSGEVINSI